MYPCLRIKNFNPKLCYLKIKKISLSFRYTELMNRINTYC